jgi:intron-binding protein aquarius
VSYLCNKQAKVVAMTCTHAALKRREFLNLGLKYDNIVMEEAGQVRFGMLCVTRGLTRG